MLGSDLRRSAPDSIDLHHPSRDELDVTDPDDIRRWVSDVDPRWIVNAAAYTDVDRAEAEPDAARRLNAEAVAHLGEVATAHPGRPGIVHYSTDYVFDGAREGAYAESDRTSPLGEYGRTKADGERRLVALGAPHLTIRTQWLFGVTGRSFPRVMWTRALARQETRVVDDQRGRPTSTADLARATWRLIGRLGSPEALREVPTYPRLHVANSGTATWFDVAGRVFARADASDCLSPCSSSEYPTTAPRPASSVLDLTASEALLGGPLRPWTAALDEFLDVLEAE